MAALRAGVATRVLPTPPGIPMMGYGAREGSAVGVHDPLHARALYLAGEHEDVLWVQCELCLLLPSQADRLRSRMAAETGVPAERVLLGCIHTHAGPETGLFEELRGSDPPAYMAPLEDAIVDAARAAAAEPAPARLGVGLASAAIGRNRRRERGPVDPRVLVVRVDDASGRARAVLFTHGCHPTALGHENLEFSADWPGFAGRVVERELPGAVAIFALSAHADVDPRTRGLLDLAIPGQSLGVGFEETERLGAELGQAVADVAVKLETRADAPVRCGAARLELPVHPPSDPGPALAALELPPGTRMRTADWFRAERERTRGLPADERRERVAAVRRYLRDRTAQRLAGGKEIAVALQVLVLGSARLLALPAEPTVDVGLDWQRRAGSPHAAVLSIVGGWLRYLPHPVNFREDGAHTAYEILQSTLAPEAATRLLDAGEALLGELQS